MGLRSALPAVFALVALAFLGCVIGYGLYLSERHADELRAIQVERVERLIEAGETGEEI